ncbi:MAG: 1-(5-phosphoribosyl)-5-[(5-phosphoribosylamino)methylideneamino]imidazole-4-carboxamide isomerase [Chloroflexota bacterium]
MFEVIPAIDLRGGKCVRLRQGDFEQATSYQGDPPEIARAWQAAGARWLHVVDLDGAKDGRPTQLDTVARIVRAVDMSVELGGGLRTQEDVAGAFEIGVNRVILGTAALEDRRFLEAMVRQHEDAVAVGIDARDGRVATRGWLTVSEADATEFAQQLEAIGVRTIIYTDISRDGMLAGPNVAAMRAMATAVPSVNVIASGGVGEISHVRELLPTGVGGVIIGKALYDGAVDLCAAVGLAGTSAAC